MDGSIISTRAFFEIPQFPQRFNRKLSPNFPGTFVAFYRGIFCEPTLSTEKDWYITFYQGNFREPTVPQRWNRKLSPHFPETFVCILSKNLLRAHTFHCDIGSLYWHYIKAFSESPHSSQTQSRKLSPNFLQTFVAFYQGIFWEPALSTEVDRRITILQAIFESPQCPQILNRMLSHNFPKTFVCILSSNLLKARTFQSELGSLKWHYFKAFSESPHSSQR